MFSRITALRSCTPFVLLLAPATANARTAAGDDVLAKLTPRNTAVFVRASSLEKLDAALKRIVGAFEPDAAMSLDELIRGAELPIAPEDVDHQRPIAFCLVLPEGGAGDPAPALLIPAASADNLVRSIADSGFPVATTVDEGYVCVTMGTGAGRGTSPAPIALNLPPGEIVARIDVKRLVEHFRPMIDMGLAQMEAAMAQVPLDAAAGLDVKPIMKSYADGARTTVESAQSLDLVLRLDGDRLEIGASLTALEKSPLAAFGSTEKTRVRDLARCLHPDASVRFVAGMDPVGMTRIFKPFLESCCAMYPEPLRSDVRKMMLKTDELAACMGNSFCGSADFAQDGLRYAAYFAPKDSRKLLATYRAMLEGAPSIALKDSKEIEIDGVPATSMRLQVDAKAFGAGSAEQTKLLEKMYGPDGISATFASKGEYAVFVLGGDEAYLESCVARLSAASSTHAGLDRGLAAVGDLNPCFVLRYDIGKLLFGMRRFAGDAMPGLPADVPNVSASLTCWGGVDGRVWRGATSVDLKELGGMVRAMRSAERKASVKPAGLSPEPSNGR